MRSGLLRAEDDWISFAVPGPIPLDRSMSRFDYLPKLGSTMNSHLGGKR